MVRRPSRIHKNRRKGLIMKDIFGKCFEPQKQDELRAAGIYPYFRALESRQDVEVIMEGKRRIMLGSNNYLGDRKSVV